MMIKIWYIFSIFVGVFILRKEKVLVENETTLFFLSILGLLFIILGAYFKLINLPFANKRFKTKSRYFFSSFYIFGLAIASGRIIFSVFFAVVFTLCFYLKNGIVEKTESEEKKVQITGNMTNALFEVVVVFMVYMLLGITNFFKG